jgi:thymidylate synthase
MKNYLDMLSTILETGFSERNNIPEGSEAASCRTGEFTKKLFKYDLSYDLSTGKLPMVTAKKQPWKATVAELLWCMNGERHLSGLIRRGCTFWNKWPYQRLVHMIKALNQQAPGESEEEYMVRLEASIPTEETFGEAMKMLIDDPYKLPDHKRHLLIQADDMGPLYGYQWRHWTNYTFATTVGNKGKLASTSEDAEAAEIARVKAILTMAANFDKDNLTSADAQRLKKLWSGDLTELDRSTDIYQEGKGIDQLAEVVEKIKNKPNDRRMIVSSWNVSDLDEMILPPCHACHINHYVRGEYLDVHMVQRSCDAPIGVPVNITFYSLYTIILAQITGKKPGMLHWTGENVHIYENQIDAVQEMITREPYELPTVEIRAKLSSLEDIKDLKVEDFVLKDYKHHPKLVIPVSV